MNEGDKIREIEKVTGDNGRRRGVRRNEDVLTVIRNGILETARSSLVEDTEDLMERARELGGLAENHKPCGGVSRADPGFSGWGSCLDFKHFTFDMDSNIFVG